MLSVNISHTRAHLQGPVNGERVKAGSPDSCGDSDSTDGHSKAPQLVPKGTDLGKRVLFYSSNDKKEKYGVLRYLGEPEFAEGVWCGIELDKPDGKNNGSKHGIRYFTCEPNHGVFVLLSKVELDSSRRSRSRPNSAPSSRTPSVERPTKKVKTITPVAGSGKPHLNTYMLQQELVNRLSTPIQKRKPTQQPSSARGPMKAFATKGVEPAATQTRSRKPNLTPFKSGGIQKAVSSENLRSLREKENKSQSGGIVGKKSSSQKDLRSSTSNLASAGKGRKPTRANSYSELFDDESRVGGTGGGGSGNGKNKTYVKAKSPSTAALRKSADLSLLSDTLLHGWPRTSTPGDRNDQTPDGCSSPEGAEMSDSRSTTSSTVDTTTSGFEKMDTDTPPVQERGFVETPDNCHSVIHPSVESPPTGLVTPANQFVKNERKSPTVGACQVVSPDNGSSLHKQVFKNRPSGTATLSHPLTLQAAGSRFTNGIAENGIENSSFLSPASFMEQFLGPNDSVSSISSCHYLP